MKTSIILQREYSTRVKKKSFVIMTILAPLLMAGFIIGYSYLIMAEETEERLIGIIDDSMIMHESLQNTDAIKFELIDSKGDENIKELYDQSNYHAILFIPENITISNTVKLFSESQPSQAITSHIKTSIENYLEDQRLIQEGISRELISSLKVRLNLDSIKWGSDGSVSVNTTSTAMIVGYLGGFLIYFFIFLYGVQVMRGIIEEKTNRIVEVIISSVKPFQLMMGKIFGIALVGLTQFIAWVVLIAGFSFIGLTYFSPSHDAADLTPAPVTQDIMASNPAGEAIEAAGLNMANPDMIQMIMNELANINFVTVLLLFLFFFIGGYLLYASLFASIGAAVDSETDTQQFMMPVTLPLVLGIMVMINAIQNPDGNIAFWFSMIPFTSPIVMMVRIPFGVPVWELSLSMALLILTFIVTTWLASKIYRTGILMYGKKVSYKELWKWIKYSR